MYVRIDQQNVKDSFGHIFHIHEKVNFHEKVNVSFSIFKALQCDG